MNTGDDAVSSPMINHIVRLCRSSPSSMVSGQYFWSNTPLKNPTGNLAKNSGAELSAMNVPSLPSGQTLTV
eukprot:CAMPEP_0178886408 /NCGR_PEP_ID=MMETSP0747-20121128/15964_1 /TAXON_ID=913974 /ORGANISM="Nitzschia punctata, Strain CCMP561" /LENGTH=70 /DNA_ID=CAMNT_0020555333 /DNA_START=40 /DNA_END=252 /DNA_ORIENTATION=+